MKTGIRRAYVVVEINAFTYRLLSLMYLLWFAVRDVFCEDKGDGEGGSVKPAADQFLVFGSSPTMTVI